MKAQATDQTDQTFLAVQRFPELGDRLEDLYEKAKKPGCRGLRIRLPEWAILTTKERQSLLEAGYVIENDLGGKTLIGLPP